MGFLKEPNVYTVVRIFCAFSVGFLLGSKIHPHGATSYGLALLVFIAAAITDILDGWLARTYNFKTKWGAFLDSLADKLLYLIPLWFLQEQIGIKIFWATLVIESLLMLQRVIKLARGNKAIEANGWGKTKTWWQYSAIISALLNNFSSADFRILAAFSIIAALAGLVLSIISLVVQIFSHKKPK